MTTKKSSFLFVLIFNIFAFSSIAEDNWVIAAQKFTYTGNQNEKVMEGAAEMFPTRILEKISTNLVRAVRTEESYDRTAYNLKTERASLFLQLSAAIKKRDSLLLSNYSSGELKSKIRSADADIQAIKKKLEANLEEEEAARKKAEKLISNSENKKDENSYITFFKGLFSSKSSSQTVEQLGLYKDDNSTLFTAPGKEAFEAEVVAEKINGLISGSFTVYEDYVYLTVELHQYPGGKKLASVSDVGVLSDADYLCSNIARQLIPAITNSMPIHLQITVLPEKLDVHLYIDDVLQQNDFSDLIVDAGVHHLQFVADGYKSVGTNYYFQGNLGYRVEVQLEKAEKGNVYLHLKNPVEGDFYSGGIIAEKTEKDEPYIKINGSPILGEFITSDNQSMFFYVPENLAKDGNKLSVNSKIFDKDEYIEKRRRWMYTSYSALVTSVIPLMITQGQVKNYQNAVNLSADDLAVANGWAVASNICTGITIGAGCLFIYELVRYLLAANSVLPSSVKLDMDYIPPEKVQEETVGEEIPAENQEAAEEDADNPDAFETETDIEKEALLR